MTCNLHLPATIFGNACRFSADVYEMARACPACQAGSFTSVLTDHPTKTQECPQQGDCSKHGRLGQMGPKAVEEVQETSSVIGHNHAIGHIVEPNPVGCRDYRSIRAHPMNKTIRQSCFILISNVKACHCTTNWQKSPICSSGALD